jgi:hypothetical protein
MWLRDSSTDINASIRFILYGYDAPNADSASETIESLSASFCHRLKSTGQASMSAKPLIMLAHSLGGVMLKYSMLDMATSGDADQYILESIKGVLTFGVPNRLTNLKTLKSMAHYDTYDHLLAHLVNKPSFLKELDDRFGGTTGLRNIRVISAFETLASHIIQVCSALPS